LETVYNDDGTFQESKEGSHNKNIPHHKKRLISVRNVGSKVESLNGVIHQNKLEDFMSA